MSIFRGRNKPYRAGFAPWRRDQMRSGILKNEIEGGDEERYLNAEILNRSDISVIEAGNDTIMV
jgi:hypothetical protein